MTRHLRPVLASLVLVAVLAALVPVSLASAQELGEEPPADGEATPPSGEVDEGPRGDDPGEDPTAGAFEVTGERLPVPDDAVDNGSQGVIVWSEGRRVYQLISGPAAGSFNGNAIAAFDLDTLQEVDRAVIAEPGFVFYGDQWSHAAAGVMPVDRSGGRLFLPYMPPPENECGNVTADVCIAGIYVVDARTLEVRADLPFQPIGIDGVVVRPALRAMSYAGEGPADGKLLLLVDAQGLAGGLTGTPPGDRAGISYAMQLDPADGSVDWVQRVAGCTSMRQASGVSAASGVRNVIFRSDLAGRPPEIYLGCYASGGGGVIARLTLDPDQPDGAPVAQDVFPGPGPVEDMVGDPQSGRVLLHAAPGTGDSLVVFDGQRSAFTTALGIGGSKRATATGFDPVDGRLYAISTRSAVGGGPGASRFLAGTTRGETLPQLTPVPSLADLVARHRSTEEDNDVPLVVDPATDSRPARVLVRPGPSKDAPDFYYVVEDRRPPGAVIGGDLVRDVPLTDDVPQVAGATDAVFTGAGRGYGFRTLLVGGVAAVASQANARQIAGIQLNRPPGETVDNLSGLPGLSTIYPEEGLAGRTAPIGDSCIARDREFVFGLAGALDVLPDLGPTGSAAQAVAATTDTQTAEDLAAPSRCGEGLLALVSTLLADAGVRQPGQVEGVGLSPAWAEAGCVAPGEQTSDEQGSQITPASTSFAAATCEEGRRTTGTGRVRLVELGPVTVGEASSSFQIDREPGGGLVTTVRSIARDIDVAGVVQIDAVESTAVSWATGRSQPAGTDGFNCAQGRTAGTCLKRTLQGVTAGDFRCDQCAVTDEQMLAALKAALGGGWTVTVGEPDAFLAQGAVNGALAGILKSPDRQFSDGALNSDILPTLPALELVRINDDAQGRGRQVYQFAGVEASTSFGILCLLEVIDGECTQQPGALAIELLDLDGLPLAGGVFELYRDLDADADASPTPDPDATDEPSPDPTAADADASPTPDPDATDEPSPDPTETEPAGDGGSTPPASPDGSLVDPLVDELVDGGVCTTTADGRGDCRFDTLAPGDYIVRQTAAPAGFLAAPDFAITIASGQDLTATFTNASAIGQVDITLVDDDGAPLAGGAFTLTPAATGGLSADGGDPAGSCTTGADGTCSITVALPDGPAELVLSQTGAPDGFAPAPDTPLTLVPGETFTFAFTNVRLLGGTISIGLVDDLTDAPLAGGRFEVHADDGDATLGASDTLVATCTTGGDGACFYDPVTTDAASLGRDGPLFASGALLTVPLGAYVVRQAAAPDGYTPADDLAFAFDTPGQAAAITVRNGSGTAADGARPQGSSQVSIGSAPSFSPAPIASGPLPMQIDAPSPQIAPTDGARMGGPTVQQILQAPADLARLVVRNPRQALAFIATWLLFAAAAMTISRRLTLTDTLAA